MTNLVETNLTGASPEAAAQHPLFTASPVASLLYGADGAVVAANAAALRILRCDTAELDGVAVATLVPELRQVISVDAHMVFRRMAVRRPDGNNFIARVQLTPLPRQGAGPTWLATLEDLTEYEQEVAAAQSELETFMSAAGHDLRGPLRILKSFTESLDDECGESLQGEGKSMLAEILKAADRMEGLIDGLLAMSRAGRADMACESLDVSTLVGLVLYELRHAKNSREVAIDVQPDIKAWGDLRLFMVVLRNLLGNAWKFTSRTAQPEVRIYTETRGDTQWICVTDNGAGFDMAHAERLFQPFTRLHRQDEFPGHGLGLATVRRIIKRHGGDVEAEAAPNQGMTVRFWMRPAPQD